MCLLIPLVTLQLEQSYLMVLIRPTGSFMGQFGKQDQDLLYHFPHWHPLPPPLLAPTAPFSFAQPSCRVSKLQLKLTWAGERKLHLSFFFLPLAEILDEHSWFDFKGTLSERVRLTRQRLQSAFCQSLYVHFGPRGSASAPVCFPELLSCFVCLVESEVVSQERTATHTTTSTFSTTAAAHWTCVLTDQAAVGGTHRVADLRIEICGVGRTAFKPGSRRLKPTENVTFPFFAISAQIDSDRLLTSLIRGS